MPTVRIATFNCENLFARYRFGKNVPAPMAEFTIEDIAFEVHSTRAKRITAKAIKAIDADIICLQEVENQPVMDRFNSEFLAWSSAKRYRYRVLLDGNDPRHIDVGFLSRYPIKSIRSHRHDRTDNNRANVFSRDCLRVDFDVEGHGLTLYGNHFKSMMGGRATAAGKAPRPVISASITAASGTTGHCRPSRSPRSRAHRRCRFPCPDARPGRGTCPHPAPASERPHAMP